MGGQVLLAGRIKNHATRHGETTLVTGSLPGAPLTQPPTMALKRPAGPPACTRSNPPGRNFGKVASLNAS